MMTRLLAGTALLALMPTVGAAKVVDFEIVSQSPAYEGQSFADAGTYERIDAIATIALDPTSERARNIVGLDSVPLNDDGMVTFTAEVAILRPATGSGSGTLFYEVVNRGRNLSFQGLNLAKAGAGFDISDPGDGFLMNRGHTVVWSGWQTHLPDDFLNLTLPVQEGVTGNSREQFIFDDTETVSTGALTYPAASLDPAAATLTVRATTDDAPTTPEGLSFRYINEQTIEITRPEGSDGGAIYDFVYPAKDPVPAGLAFIAISDVVSFLRGSAGHEAESPLEGIDHTIAMGISQPGRLLRDFIYQGFNEDEAGAKVFDGAMPHIAGSRKTFTNYPFALPGRYSRQHEDHDFPGDQFPFTYVTMTDSLTGETDSILARCEASDTCPMLMHTDTDTEFWQGRAALVSTSPEGEALTMPDNVRLYYLPGAPHFNFWGDTAKDTATCNYSSNPISPAPVLRALTVAMEEWIADGVAPPDSVYPGLNGSGLVDLEEFRMPEMVDGAPQPKFNQLRVMNHDTIPATEGEPYAARVPEIDEDGIAQVGIKLPYIAAPVGTYMGWNVRSDGFAAGELCSLTGSYIPFPEQPSETETRAPLSERYADERAYEEAMSEAARGLVEQRLMLDSDVSLVVDAAPSLTLSTQ